MFSTFYVKRGNVESLRIYIQQLTYLKIISEQNDQKTQLFYGSKEDPRHKSTAYFSSNKNGPHLVASENSGCL